MKLKNNLLAILAVVIVSVTGVASAVSYNVINDRDYNLEKAVRLQNLTNMALNNANYDLACKAQQEVTESVRRAGIIDVVEQIDAVESEICSMSWTSSIAAK